MATAFYSGTFVLIAVGFYVFIRAAFQKPLLAANTPQEFVAKTRHDYTYGPPMNLPATFRRF